MIYGIYSVRISWNLFRWRLVSKREKFVDLTPIGSATRLRFLQRWTNPRTIVYVNLRHSWLMFIDISCIFRRVVINNPTFSKKSSWAYRSKVREFVFETAYTSFRKANRWLLYVFFFFHQRNTWEMLFSGLTSELNNLIVKFFETMFVYLDDDAGNFPFLYGNRC